MIEVNYWYVLLAAVAQFVLGALWYSPLIFGKWWMQVMEVTHLSKEELAKMQREMLPAYILQFVCAFVTVLILAFNISLINFVMQAIGGAEMFASAGTTMYYWFAFFMWLGYILPIQIGGVMWSQTKKKNWAKQIFVASSYQLVAIMLATFILTM